MKLVTYEYEGQSGPGAVVDGMVIDLTAVAPDIATLIAGGPAIWAQAAALAGTDVHALPLDDVNLRPPIPRPLRNIMCLGKNYAEHARESHEAWGEAVDVPSNPVIFNKATTTINGPFDDIPIDPAISEKMDYEVELAVVIGRAGKNIAAENALDHIFGYMVVNDITARDIQRRHQQFFKGKSLDGSCPTGPWIVTADEVPDPHDLDLMCHVNGELRQEGNTADMIFNITDTIAILSQGMTLLPGDIIATGTPAGVGFAMDPPVFLKDGDIIESEVEGIGRIRNRVVALAD